MNRASWTQEDLQSEGEVFLEKKLSLRTAQWWLLRWRVFCELPIIFTLLALIIYVHVISFVLNKKYEDYFTLNGCYWITDNAVLGYQPVVSHKPFLLQKTHLFTTVGGMIEREDGLKIPLQSYLKLL
jgi:hypothetical protein